MKTRYISLFIIASITLAGCTRHIEDEINPMDKDIVFKAGWEDSSNSTTKTVLQEDGTSVWWSTDEKINVFYGNTRSGVFTSTNTTPAAEASFTGTLALKDGVTEESQSANYWAVYPYNENNTCDGESVTLTIPANQIATEGTFADNFFPAVARSKNSKLSFYNVCGGVTFSVTNDGIQYVTFRGNADENLAGKVKVVFDSNGKPQVESIVDGTKEIRIDAPGDSGFEVGKWYYIASIPTTLSSGYTMTFFKDEQFAKLVTDSSVSIRRSTFGKLTDADDIASATQPDNEIWYTSSDEQIVTPQNPYSAKVVSNTYQDGKGVIIFDQPLTRIDGGSFMNETRITSVSIPSGVTQIEWCAFLGCSNLVEVIFPDGLKRIDNCAFLNCLKLKSPILPDSVTIIETCAFSGCETLSYVHLPESLTQIDYYAFGGCNALTTIDISDIQEGFTSFVGVFDNCENISLLTGSLASSDGRCIIKDGALYLFASAGLTSFSVPEGVTEIKGTFNNCNKLTSIELPEGLTIIGASSFSGTGISRIHIPESVTSIAPAFTGCKSLEEFTGKYATADNRCLIDNGKMVAFAPAGLTSYSIPDGVTTIESAFSGASIVSVSLPGSLTQIGSSAFLGCALQAIDIPAGVTSIGRYAFYGCTSLSTITIPTSVTSIEECAFYGCSSLSSIVIPSGVTQLGKYIIGNCPAMESVTLLPTTPPSTDYFPIVSNGDIFQPYITFPILVPAEALQTYQQAAIWSEYADMFHAYSTQGNVEFADANFKAYCVENFDTNGDGEISLNEALMVTAIDVNPEIIASLKGIEYFKNLQSLTCSLRWDSANFSRDGYHYYRNGEEVFGLLTSLDLSSNTALTDLYCYSNQLSSLDVSNNTALTRLDCSNNQLSSLDVSHNTALTELSCSSNQLSSLDVSNNTALTTLWCDSNQLSSLDVSNNTALTRLESSNNPLSSLDISNNTALTYLCCQSNQLSSLDVSNNTALTYLNCAYNPLSSLDVSNNTALTYLWCSSNQLSSLDVSNNTALTDLLCYFNQLSSLDVSNNTALTDLECCYNQLSSLDVSNNTALTRLFCFNNQLSNLDVSNNTALTDLYCYSNQLSSLDVSNNTALTYLDCSSNQLSSLDVSKNTALTYLWCSSNQLSSLDVSNNTAVYDLHCSSNQLSSLDVSKNTALIWLDCFGNPSLTEIWLKTGQTIENLAYDSNITTIKYRGIDDIVQFTDANFKAYCVTNFDKDGDGEVSVEEALDVTEINCCTDEISSLKGIEYFVNLESLTAAGSKGKSCSLGGQISVYGGGSDLPDPEPGNSVASGRLTDIEISGLSKLTLINISRNSGITSFNPGCCPSLRFLYSNMTNLSELNLTQNTAIERLELIGNRFSSLDLSSCHALERIMCSSCQLTSLDFSNCTLIKSISCHHNNSLESINTNNCTSLTSFICFDNQLSNLDVSNNTALTTLYCYNNQLDALNVESNTALTSLWCFGNQLSALDVRYNTALTSLKCGANLLTSLDVSSNLSLTLLDCFQDSLLSELWLKNGQTIESLNYNSSVTTIKYK